MLPLLAEFTPLSNSAQMAVVSLLILVSLLLTIWSLTRRHPPLDAHLTKFEGSIATLTKAVDELTKAQRAAADHSTRIAQLERECSALRLELDEKITDQRDATDEGIQRVYLRIESLEQSVSRNFQTIERSLGRIEGELKARASAS